MQVIFPDGVPPVPPNAPTRPRRRPTGAGRTPCTKYIYNTRFADFCTPELRLEREVEPNDNEEKQLERDSRVEVCQQQGRSRSTKLSGSSNASGISSSTSLPPSPASSICIPEPVAAPAEEAIARVDVSATRCIVGRTMIGRFLRWIYS